MTKEELELWAKKVAKDVVGIGGEIKRANITTRGKLLLACEPYAQAHANMALEATEFTIGNAKKLLVKSVLPKASMLFIDANKWDVTINDIFQALGYWADSLLKSGGGGGWEKKVLALCNNKAFDGTARWPARFGFFLIGNRTTTYYGFRYSGKQGPHTVARILGVKSRIQKVRQYIKDNTPTFPKQFNTMGCSSKEAVEMVHSMYIPYLDIPGSSSLLPKLSIKFWEIVHDGQTCKYAEFQKRFATTKFGRGLFITKFGISKYAPDEHAYYAHTFYRACYDHASTNGDLLLMMAFGQIMADLHPLATVTTDRMASFDDTKGGGEAASMRDLEAAVKVNEIAAAVRIIVGTGLKKRQGSCGP